MKVSEISEDSRVRLGLVITLFTIIVGAVWELSSFREEVQSGRQEFSREIQATREQFSRENQVTREQFSADIASQRKDTAVMVSELQHTNQSLSKISESLDGHFELITATSRGVGELKRDFEHIREDHEKLEARVNQLESRKP